jgi:DNA processing protein
MDIKNFILFLKCFDGVGDAAIRKIINNHCLDDLDIQSVDDIISWFNTNAGYFSSRFDLKTVNKDTILLAKTKRQSTISKLAGVNADFITCLDENYPETFRNMKDFPVVLFYKGDITLLSNKKVCSIIGTREPSAKTQEFGKNITNSMVQKGYVIVSGLAQGCDTIAHSSCIEAGGKTVAIMGTGIDIVFPKENTSLAERIINTGGLLITEELPGVKGASYSFVNRDRLQAASAEIVIVLATSADGGTMHAAKATKDKYNKLLKVVAPACIPDADSTGNSELINQYGAISITSVEDL